MRGIGRLEGCDETAAASTHRIRTQLPDQRTLHWLFYGSGHLHQINIEMDGRHELISDIERDALHREVGRSQGQLASQYEHDPQGRLLKHRALRMGNAQQVALERSYQYDASGNLTQRQDSLRGEQRFRYDPTGRILQATGKVEEYFAFDPAGNLLAQRSGPQPAIGGNRLKVWQELRFEYDVHGNVVQRRKGAHEEAQLRWNAEHQLLEAEVTRHGVTQTTRYAYDALGRRVSKSDAFGSTHYLWDGDLLLQSQRRARQALFIYEPNSFVPLATVQEGQTYWYQCDQIGAPLELTDSQGQVAWAAEYRVWGEAQLLATGTHGASGSRWGARAEGRPALEQPFRFQGQQFDEETGLHYNRFRYYDPGVGRFASQDPIGLEGGINTFLYGENPTGRIDPFGLSSARLDRKLGGRKGDCHEAHHLIPEEVMKDPQYKSMFDRLKSMGFDPDGAGNGIHLPANETLAQQTGLPGHWSSHDQYTQSIKSRVDQLFRSWQRGQVSDTQLALGVKDIQRRAKDDISSGRVQVNSKCRLI
nr:RHS repeat-associated core domain-containing protein [Pelomonas sp. BJYL3]